MLTADNTYLIELAKQEAAALNSPIQGAGAWWADWLTGAASSAGTSIANTAKQAITGKMTESDANAVYQKCIDDNRRAGGTAADLQKCFNDVGASIAKSGGTADTPGTVTSWLVLGGFALAGFFVATQ